jgi:hypothetical protein
MTMTRTSPKNPCLYNNKDCEWGWDGNHIEILSFKIETFRTGLHVTLDIHPIRIQVKNAVTNARWNGPLYVCSNHLLIAQGLEPEYEDDYLESMDRHEAWITERTFL